MFFHSHMGRLFLGLLLAGLGTLSLAAQTIIEAGAVSGTWTPGGSPYLVQGNITIESSQQLRIEAGTEIRFAAGTGLVVTEYGRLFAEGTPEALIVFTSQAASPAPGDWTGLKFARTGNRVTVRYCRIEYAATAILCTSWDCKCEADDNFSVIEYCQIRWNSEDGIFCLAEGCSGWICVPTDPLGESSPTIRNNWICANGGYGIRMEIHHGDTRPEIIRNVIDSNGLGAIRCDGGGPTIHNNDLLHHAGAGIGGYLGNDRLRIVNNIIAWNDKGVEALLQYTPEVMQFNILWQNGIDYSGMAPTGLDLTGDPRLMNHLAQDYALQADSPCIDSGDPRLERDPDLTPVDIGAYYFHQSGSMPPAADFMADEAAGVFPLTTGLVDLSSGKVSAWNWDFGDGTSPPAADTHYPIHTYERPGNYTVTLTVSGPDGEDTLQREDYLQVLPRSPSATDIVYPQIALGGGYTCIFMAGNRTDREWHGRMELRQGFEAAWSVPWCLDGEPQAGFSVDVTLAPGATRKFIMTSDKPLQAGYLRVMSEQLPARDTLATALFYNYQPAGDLVDSTATPQSQPGSRFWFLAEKSDIINTGLAYCSADRQRDFDVTLTLYDADGNLFDQAVMNYDGHTARFFAGADGIFPAVPEGFLGAVLIESAADICLAVLSMTATGENAFQLTSLPPAHLPPAGSGASPAVVYPHVALGGGYECTFLAGNHTDAAWSGNVELLQGLDDPWPTAWSLDGVPQGGHAFPLTLQPRQTRKFVLSSHDPLQAGYLRLAGDKSAATDALATAFSYRYCPDGPLLDSTATPQSQRSDRFFFLVEKTDLANTGFAFCAADLPGGFPVSLTLLDREGTEIGQHTLDYDGYAARFFAGADGIFPDVPDGFSGAIRIDSAADLYLAVLGFTVTAGDSFQLTSLPPRPDPPPVAGVLATLEDQGDPRGLACQGTDLWILDGQDNQLTKIDPAGNVLDTVAAPGIDPQGLACDGANLWWADAFGFEPTIYRLDLSQAGGATIPLTYRWYPWPRGVAWDGSAFWVAEVLDKKIYRLDTAGNVLGSIPTPGSWPSGMAFDGSHLWLADDVARKIYKLDMATGNVLFSFDSPGISPQGLAFDGTYLWHSDYHSDEIYKLNTAGNVVGSFDSPTFAHFGMAFDGIYLYLVDYDNEIFKMDRNGTVVETFLSPAQRSRGMTHDGQRLWVVDDQQDKLLEISPGGSGITEFTAPVGHPEGLAWDGSCLWVSDSENQMIHRLDTAGNVLASFDSPGPDPQDLAFDGTCLWHIDAFTKKIYRLDTSGTVVDFFDCAGHDGTGTIGRPQGLAFDGVYIWMGDTFYHQIHQMDVRR